MSTAVSTKNLSLISRTKTTPRDPKITSGSISSSAGIPTDFSEYERWQGVCAGISQSVRLSSLKDSLHFYDPLTAFGGDYAFARPTISQQLLGGRGRREAGTASNPHRFSAELVSGRMQALPEQKREICHDTLSLETGSEEYG